MQLNSLGLSWGDADEHKLSRSVRGPRSQTGHHSAGILSFDHHAMVSISSTCRDQKLPPSDATELHSLPHGLINLTSLESLEIIECPNLVSLPEESLEGLSSLRSLSIENCHGLTSLP
ncbi:hypothetical protein D5086_021326, partial [Populus alba]